MPKKKQMDPGTRAESLVDKYGRLALEVLPRPSSMGKKSEQAYWDEVRKEVKARLASRV